MQKLPVIFALLLVGWVPACEKDEAPAAGADAATRSAKSLELRPFDPPPSTPLLEGIELEEKIEVTESQRYPECHEIFEPGGELVAKFPLEERVERALALAGCAPEAFGKTSEGIQYVAYARPSPPGTRATNLRFLKFDAAGKLQWHAEQDRQREGANFIANYRDSFIAPLPPHLDCAGTLWEGGTGVMCVEAETGEEKWAGRLAFWAGIAPQPYDGALVVADLGALTKRYPYSGVEMAHQNLSGTGGRSGFYATDGKALYFGPGKTGESQLLRYDFETLRPVWRRDLPGHPVPNFEYVFADFDLLILKEGEVIYGLDTEDGHPRWAFEVGESLPSVAASEDTLFVLHRRSEKPNILLAIDPEDGTRKWASSTPLGTLSVEVIDGIVMLKAVKAVQHVQNLDALQKTPE